MPHATTAEAFAPAKVNLTLHVTGRRADGYHLLDSLVAFADVGDMVTVAAAEAGSFRVTGRFGADVPQDGDNIVLRAARLADPGFPVAITLDKRLPAASGIGGGSSDAAACLRALAELSGRTLPAPDAVLSLGADVPVCLVPRTARMAGIGEAVRAAPALPPCWLVLVNPGVPVPTPSVFAALHVREYAPMPAMLPAWADAAELAAWLGAQRNDLEAPARQIAPEVGGTVKAIERTHGCLIARMSGSGATCFGLYKDADAAKRASGQIAAAQPGWWVVAAPAIR